MPRPRGPPSLARRPAPAIVFAVVVTAGCQTADPDAAPATAGSPPPAVDAASVVDGVWEAHMDWAVTKPAGCPLTGDGETRADFRMTLSRGALTIVASTDVDPRPAVGARSHYQVFRDRIAMDDGTTARFELDDGTLTFSDVEGGGCDGRTVMATVPWQRVDG